MCHNPLSLAVLSGMPPKNSLRGKGKGKAQRKSARPTRPPARLVEASSGEEVDVRPSTPPTPEISTKSVMAQLLATNERLDQLAQRLDQGPSTSRSVQPVPSSMESEPQTFMGEATDNLLKDTGAPAGESGLAAFMTLGMALEPRVKAKIWSLQYVELASLGSPIDRSLAVTFDHADIPRIALTASKPKPISNIFQWLRLFGTYAAIYLERYPAQAPSLITYMMQILDLQKKYAGVVWSQYDSRCRQLKAQVDMSRPNSLPWHVVNYQLVLDVLHADNPLVRRPGTQPSQQHRRGEVAHKPFLAGAPTGATGCCYAYNQPAGCQRQRCKFRHDCQFCGKYGHPAIKCFAAIAANSKGEAASTSATSSGPRRTNASNANQGR